MNLSNLPPGVTPGNTYINPPDDPPEPATIRANWPHVMVDIETMGTAQSKGAIISVGACGFDPRSGEVANDPAGSLPRKGEHGITQPPLGGCFYENVSLQSALNLGLEVDGRTVQWWLEQSSAARGVLKTPPPIPVLSMLSLLYRWYQRIGAKYIWSNGSTFDVAILSTAYQLAGKQTPWHWRDVRDTRTAWWILSEVEGARKTVSVREEHYIAHYALDDARRQAKSINEAIRRICLGPRPIV